MADVRVSPEQLLTFRDEKNKEIFLSSVDAQTVRLSVQASESVLMYSDVNVNDDRLPAIRAYANKPVNLESLMLETHDFGDSTTWADVNDSTFTLAPNAGYKLIITSIIARFPEDVNLNNTLSFKVFKYVPPYGVVEAVSQSYGSIRDLLVQSNSPWHTVDYINDNAFTKKMIEVKFRYAGSDDADWSKLTLYSSRGEYLTSSLSTHTALLNTSGQALGDPCYAIYNTKRVKEL